MTRLRGVVVGLYQGKGHIQAESGATFFFYTTDVRGDVWIGARVEFESNLIVPIRRRLPVAVGIVVLMRSRERGIPAENMENLCRSR